MIQTVHDMFRRCQFGLILTVFVGGLLVAPTAHGAILTLYDGTLEAVTPNQYSAGHLIYAGLNGGSQQYHENDVDGNLVQSTLLSTSGAHLSQRGYSNYWPIINVPVKSSFPDLDRIAGYTIHFRIKMLSETHGENDRAGFSVIAISSDVGSGAATGIEIGFQYDHIFAQSAGFNGGGESHVGNAAMDGLVDYDLTVLGSSYWLYEDGSEILQGALRNYTSPSIPYTLPNYVFFGDDTTSAGAEVYLQKLAVTVPEPSSFAIMGVGFVLVVAMRRRFSKRSRPC